MNGHSDSWCYLSYCLGQRWTLGPWHNSTHDSTLHIKYAAFFLEKGILSKMKGGHCDMTPSSNLISPGCLRSECPSLCPAHMDRAHLSLSHRSPGRAGARVTPPPPPRLRHQEPALTRVSYHPDTDGDRWRDGGHSDIWDNMKKWWEFLVSHCRHRGTWGGACII